MITTEFKVGDKVQVVYLLPLYPPPVDVGDIGVVETVSTVEAKYLVKFQGRDSSIRMFTRELGLAE